MPRKALARPKKSATARARRRQTPHGPRLDRAQSARRTPVSESPSRWRRSRRACPAPAPPRPCNPTCRRRCLRLAPGGPQLVAVPHVNRVEMSLLKGIDRVRDILIENTERFANGLPANNALLWGARGMGKSSLVKAVARRVNAAAQDVDGNLKLIEIHREDIESLPDADDAAARRAVPLHRVLRRPVVRRRRHLLQIAQGGARRRHRRPAGQRHPLRHVEPPPPDVARHDGERALDRDQSGRGGRGEGVAVGPVRPLARLPPLQPGRISRHGRGLLSTTSSIPMQRRGAATARRWNGRPRAARAPAASPGSSCRIWRDG